MLLIYLESRPPGFDTCARVSRRELIARGEGDGEDVNCIERSFPRF